MYSLLVCFEFQKSLENLKHLEVANNPLSDTEEVLVHSTCSYPIQISILARLFTSKPMREFVLDAMILALNDTGYDGI